MEGAARSSDRLKISGFRAVDFRVLVGVRAVFPLEVPTLSVHKDEANVFGGSNFVAVA